MIDVRHLEPSVALVSGSGELCFLSAGLISMSATARAFDFPMFKMLLSHGIVIVYNVSVMAGGFAGSHFRAPVVLKALGRGRGASWN